MNIDYQSLSISIPIHLFLHYDYYSQWLYCKNIDYLTTVRHKYAITFGNETYLITDEHLNLSEYFNLLIRSGHMPLSRDSTPISENVQEMLNLLKIDTHYNIELKYSKDEQAFDLIMKLIYGYREVGIPRYNLIDAFLIFEELKLKIESAKSYNQNIRQEFLYAIQSQRDLSNDEYTKLLRFSIEYKRDDIIKWCHESYGLNNILNDENIFDVINDYDKCVYLFEQYDKFKTKSIVLNEDNTNHNFLSVEAILEIYAKCLERFFKSDCEICQIGNIIVEIIEKYQEDIINMTYKSFLVYLAKLIKLYQQKLESRDNNLSKNDKSRDKDLELKALADTNQELRNEYTDLYKNYEKKCSENKNLLEINWKIKEENAKLIKKNIDLQKKLKELQKMTTSIYEDSKDIPSEECQRLNSYPDLCQIDNELTSAHKYPPKVSSFSKILNKESSTPANQKSNNKCVDSDKGKNAQGVIPKDYTESPLKRFNIEDHMNVRLASGEKNLLQNLKYILNPYSARQSIPNMEINTNTNGGLINTQAISMSMTRIFDGNLSSPKSAMIFKAIHEKEQKEENNRGRPSDYVQVSKPPCKSRAFSGKPLVEVNTYEQDNTKGNIGQGKDIIHVQSSSTIQSQTTQKPRYLSSSPTPIKDIVGGMKLNTKIQDFKKKIEMELSGRSEDVSLEGLKREVGIMNMALHGFKKMIYLWEFKSDGSTVESIQKIMSDIKNKAYDEICLAIYNTETSEMFILLVVIEISNKKVTIVSPNPNTPHNMKMLQCIKDLLREKFSNIPFRHQMHTRFDQIFPIITLDSLRYLMTLWQYKGLFAPIKK